MKSKNIQILLSLLLVALKSVAQNTFDIVISNPDCSRSIIFPIEEKNNYTFIYTKGICEGPSILKVSKQGKFLDSIAINTFSKVNFSVRQLIKIENNYFMFGYKRDSINSVILHFAKTDSTFRLLSEKSFPISNLKIGNLEKISVKLSDDKSKFYLVYGQTLSKISYVGKVDVAFKNIFLKEIGKEIGDVYDILELPNKEGFIITTLASRYKTDINFENAVEILPNVALAQSHQIAKLGNKYLMIGDKIKDDKGDNLQRTMGAVLLNKDLTLAKSVRIGKSNDTVSRNTLRGLFVSNSNRFFVIGVTYKDFDNDPNRDSWLNISVIDSNLNIIGTRYYKGNGYNIPVGIIETQDKYLVFSGNSYPKNASGKANGFIMKIKSEDLLTTADKDLKFYEPLVKVFPNPVQDELAIEFQEYDNQHDIKLEIYNSLGELVHSELGNLPYQRINVHDFSSGIYFYNLYIANQLIKTGKFIKN